MNILLYLSFYTISSFIYRLNDLTKFVTKTFAILNSFKQVTHITIYNFLKPFNSYYLHLKFHCFGNLSLIYGCGSYKTKLSKTIILPNSPLMYERPTFKPYMALVHDVKIRKGGTLIFLISTCQTYLPNSHYFLHI